MSGVTTNSYEGVESQANFCDAATLAQYRRAALEKSRLQVKFVSHHFPEAARVLEACSGNGRLLIGMADQLEYGYGFDLAESRVAFASQWAADLGVKNLSMWPDDVLTPSRRAQDLRVDLVLCITGAFGYFDAIEQGAAEKAIAWLARTVVPGGGLLLELLQHPVEVAACLRNNECRLRSWIELPESDPFRFYLSDYDFDESRKILRHRKIFIDRDGHIDDGRAEALRLYTTEEVAEVLAPWFEDIEFFGDWQGLPYSPEGELLLVKATRRR